MGDLAEDTALAELPAEPGEHRFRAELSRDWDLMGPNGGYLAAIALRAAAAHAGQALPVSLSCQFLARPRFGPVHVRTEVLRASRRATAVRVRMEQGADRPVLEALVWAAQSGLAGPNADWTPAPRAPGPDGVPDLRTHLAAEGRGVPAWHRNVTLREISGRTGGADGEPRVRCWARFEPRRRFDDCWVDAGRSVILLDSLQWPAVMNAFPERETVLFAPSIDLYVAFHGSGSDSEWLLVETTGTAAHRGTFHGRGSVWTREGRLLASAGQQMLGTAVRERADRL
ncbi:thioesterase family protein [Amycolatopsis rubida]|uniref:Acyl-CoA thioesterase n=1 Tax=Amycolatopsis rubida TaxID=112413 RepID=A0A1I5SC47_9PSEU|nr:thioesterase family protein [Amycolatopsis rubida]SFP68358.1 Acyl-CoA thioesterase [Amycolatopsis rubida]